VKLVDSLLRTARNLLLILIVLAIAFPMAIHLLAQAFSPAGRMTGLLVRGFFSSALSGVLVVLFLAGLAIRVLHMTQGPQLRQRRNLERGRLKRTARRLASDIPAHGEERVEPDDEDPILPLGESK
jgi:hypothetical protein